MEIIDYCPNCESPIYWNEEEHKRMYSCFCLEPGDGEFTEEEK